MYWLIGNLALAQHGCLAQDSASAAALWWRGPEQVVVMRRKAQWGSLVGAVVLVTIAVAYGPTLREAQREQIPTQVMADAMVPEPAALNWLALGHREAVSDLLWLEAQSFAGYMTQRGVQHDHHLEPLVDGIIELDPNFYQIYMWAGTILFYEDEIRPEAVLNASRYLRMGIERFPSVWVLHRALAVNLWSELRLDDPILMRMYRAEAAEAMWRAASLPGAPAHLRSVAAVLARGTQPYSTRREQGRDALNLHRADRDAVRQARMMARWVYSPAEAEALIWGAEHMHNVTGWLTPLDIMTRPSGAEVAEPWQLRHRRPDL